MNAWYSLLDKDADGLDGSLLVSRWNDEVMFVVRRVAVEYLQPARFNDELRVVSTVKRFGQCRIVFAQNIIRDNLLVGGETEVACVSSLSFKPVKIPDNLLQALEKIA